MTQKDLNRMYDVFKSADDNSNNRISTRELAKAFNLGGANEDTVQMLLDVADTGGDGSVDFAEFVEWGSMPDSEVLEKFA